MFSPVREFTARITSRIDLVSSLTNIWSIRTDSPYQALSLPSAIFSWMFCGLSATWAMKIRFCSATASSGTSSRRTYSGLAAMMCSARSLASCLNSSLRATKSVSQLSSTITPDLASWWM